MHFQPLADDLRRFIRAHVPTMDCAEVLVQLMREAPAVLTATEVAAAVTLPAARVEVCLDRLVSAGACASTAGPDASPRFRYAPASVREERCCELLRIAYSTRPVALVREIYDAAPHHDGPPP